MGKGREASGTSGTWDLKAARTASLSLPLPAHPTRFLKKTSPVPKEEVKLTSDLDLSCLVNSNTRSP